VKLITLLDPILTTPYLLTLLKSLLDDLMNLLSAKELISAHGMPSTAKSENGHRNRGPQKRRECVGMSTRMWRSQAESARPGHRPVRIRMTAAPANVIGMLWQAWCTVSIHSGGSGHSLVERACSAFPWAKTQGG
jgi:hypothetical protein